MKTRIESRPATLADVRSVFGEVPVTVRARVLEKNGELLGIAGYYLSGGVAVFFSDIRGKIPKMTVWREALAFMEDVKLPAVCLPEEKSGPFLERLGWVRQGEEYRWLA